MQDLYQKFIILTMPRSGSNYLSYLLHDHPNIMSIGEAYCIETIWGQPGKKEINHSLLRKIYRDLLPVSFLKTTVFRSYPQSIHAVGFRLFYHQADHYSRLLQYLLSQKDVKIIHLKRKNLLENLVSFRLAVKTGTWSSLKRPRSSITRISLSPQECHEYFESTVATWKRYNELFDRLPKLDVSYEDLVRSLDRETERILSFLDVENRRLKSFLKKQNVHAFQDVVVNYRELKNYFEHSRWSSFFS